MGNFHYLFRFKKKHGTKNSNTLHLAWKFELKVSCVLGWVMGLLTNGSSPSRLRGQWLPSSFPGVRCSYVLSLANEM